jgi:hypothetical protein
MRDDIGSVSSAYKVFAVEQSKVAPDLLERIIRVRSNYFYNAISASSREGQSISSEGLGLLRFTQPSATAQETFYATTEPLSNRVRILQRECNTLTALGDKLLPKLISGQIRVKDAEKFLKEAGV